MKPYFAVSIAAAAALLSGCASTSLETSASDVSYENVPNPNFAAIGAAPNNRAMDRQAILAMRGDYRVDFNFSETVPLAPGYATRKDKTTGGYETVIVVEDGPRKVVLQHLLVSPGGHVIKHWRQDWTFEASERFEFVADQTWEVRPIDEAKTRAAWTQCVYEVSDAPRYCGTGQWNHRYGVSTWTSDRTWRPLPRREYTTRSDYNAINAENRHTITPSGWTHEQDNTKTVRRGGKTEATLVREFGFNDYRSIEGFDFAPAQDYWLETADYWARVRNAWAQRLSTGDALVLSTEVDGMPIIVGTFEHAENVATMSADEQEVAIEGLLDEWTSTKELAASR